jgi:hypothetical protein
VYHYQIYGLSIHSNIKLPIGKEFNMAESEGTLQFEGDFSFPYLTPPQRFGDHVTITTDNKHIYINRLIGQYSISNNAEFIRYRPFSSSDKSRAGSYFVGVVLPYILQMKGFVPLHGSGIVIGEKVWGFLAGPGAGKSTLQTEFLKKGYRFFSDDVLAIKRNNKGIRVFPGYPGVKLEKKVRENLPDYFVSGVELLPVGATKSIYLLSLNTVCQTSLSLGGLFILDPKPDSEEQIQINTIKGPEAVISLLTNTFTLGIVNRRVQRNYVEFFSSRLIQEIPIWKIQYPRDFNKLPSVVSELLAMIKSQL